MSLTSLALRLAAPVPKIESFQRFLFIGPHPDDIEIGAGATAAKLAAAGKQLCFLICTDGRFGDVQSPVKGDELAALRRNEALQSAAMLGVTDVRFLNLRDGGGYTQQELMAGIAQAVSDFQPDVLLAPDPCVNSECHLDHLNVGEAARRIACCAANAGTMQQWDASAASVKAVAFYMTAKPNRFVRTSGFLSRQRSAIFDCHLSQFPRGCAAASSIRLYLNLRAADFGLRSLKGCAEGFRVLGQTHMHCLPEAGK